MDHTTLKNMALLARLTLDEQDQANYSAQLTQILDFVAQMQRVDTTGIEPLAHPLAAYPSALQQQLRADVVIEHNQRDQLQVCAPQVQAGFYVVPPVIE